MIEMILQQVVREMRSHPFTLIAVLCLMGFAVWAHISLARAGEIDTLQVEVKENTERIERVLKLQLAEAIRSTARQLCNTTELSIRRDLRGTLEQLQEDYRELSDDGRGYAVPACEVLQ